MATRTPQAELDLEQEDVGSPAEEDRLDRASIRPPRRVPSQWELQPPHLSRRPRWVAYLLRAGVLKESWLPSRWQ